MTKDDENIVEFEVQSADGRELDTTAAEDVSVEMTMDEDGGSVVDGVDAVDAVDVAENAMDEGADDSGDDSAKEKKLEFKDKLRGVLGNKTLEDVIEREAHEEADTSLPFSLSRTLGGVIVSRFIHRQLGLVGLICAFLIIYITLRYMCQQKLVEIDRVENKIVEARYKATVCSSMLTEKSRESNVLKRLSECGDSTLTIPNEPPYLIKIEK